MVRKIHGNYDAVNHLPDNTGQPVGDGLYVWLQSEVKQHWPDILAMCSELPSGRRYKAEIEILHKRVIDGDRQAWETLQQFETKRKTGLHQARQSMRAKQLTYWRSRLQDARVSEVVHARKQINRLETEIERAEKRFRKVEEEANAGMDEHAI